MKSEDNFVEHDYRKPIKYIKRPNYYVYELYYNHFGDRLLSTDIKSDSYYIGDFNVYFKDVWNRIKKGANKENYLQDLQIPYVSVNASKSPDNSKVYLMVINKNLDESITANINLVDFTPARKGDAWILNGPSIDATNEKDPNNVNVKQFELEIKDTPFPFTFEPHSFTAIELKRN